MSKYYYALWIPVLKTTRFNIICRPTQKVLQDSKEFPRYIIKGDMDSQTLNFTLHYKEGKKNAEKSLSFQCESRWKVGILVYSIELSDSPKSILEEMLQQKMPTFIYHYIKDFFHQHIHHHPSHDSLLHAYFSKSPLELNAANQKAIIEHYASRYLQKFKAYTNNAQSVFGTAKRCINSRLAINRGIRLLENQLDEGREILGETDFCSALIQMGSSHIAKNIRTDIKEQTERIKNLQQQISFSYNLCTSSYGIKLGYWGIWFGAAGILASALSIYLTMNSNVPDYSPMLIQMDSLNNKRGTQTDSLIRAGQNRTNGQIDSVKKQLDNIQTQSEKQLKAIESLKQKEDKQSQQLPEHSSAN